MKGNLYNVIKCIIIALSLIICTFVDNNFELANIHFYLFVVLCIIDFAHNRTLTFQILWLVAFIFILLSEMLLNAQYLTQYQWEHKFIFFANDAVLLGYFFTRRRKMIINETQEISRGSSVFVLFISLFYVIFMIYQFPIAIMSMRVGGRNHADEIGSSNIILSTFMSSYRVVPFIIGYYIVRIKKGSKWAALLFSIPIFLLLLFNGSRFRLLFSVLPFLLICNFFQVSNINLRKIFRIVILVGLLLFVTDFMMQTRKSGLQAYNTENTRNAEVLNSTKSDYFSVKICQNGSIEGIIPILHYIKKEVEQNGYTCGKSMGFLFYFWIPRSIWPEKPVMLNSWIPAKYMKGVSDGFSSSSGFCGEPYADFGYFSIIIFVLMGYGLKKADNYLLGTVYGKKRCIHSLFAVMLIPYIPFIVRSPITATYSTFMNGLFVYFFYVTFFKKKGSNKH